MIYIMKVYHGKFKLVIIDYYFIYIFSRIFTRINIDSPFLIYWLQHGLDLKFLSFSNTIEYFVPNTEENTENQGKVVECHLDPLR